MVMLKANVFEVKAKLSEYLDRAARGERIVICRHNKPVAELRPFMAVRSEPRPIGPLPGRPTFDLPASFFEPLSDDELDQWEGTTATDPLSSGPTQRPGRNASRVAESTKNYRPPRRTHTTRRKK
jgi:antitoxin (DNA-binding transcriptional repressor) of toxin-antitoxin stability system